MVNCDLFQHSGCDALARPKHIYLEANLDLLCQSTLREHGLDLGHNGAVDNPTWRQKSLLLRTYVFHLFK